MEGLEVICFELISNVGDAKSSYIQAIREAKKGDFETAQALIKAGDESFVKGHKVHATLVQNEAAGENTPISLILIHAEDQLMSAESFKILSSEFIHLYKTVSMSIRISEV